MSSISRCPQGDFEHKAKLILSQTCQSDLRLILAEFLLNQKTKPGSRSLNLSKTFKMSAGSVKFQHKWNLWSKKTRELSVFYQFWKRFQMKISINFMIIQFHKVYVICLFTFQNVLKHFLSIAQWKYSIFGTFGKNI